MKIVVDWNPGNYLRIWKGNVDITIPSKKKKHEDGNEFYYVILKNSIEVPVVDAEMTTMLSQMMTNVMHAIKGVEKNDDGKYELYGAVAERININKIDTEVRRQHLTALQYKYVNVIVGRNNDNGDVVVEKFKDQRGVHESVAHNMVHREGFSSKVLDGINSGLYQSYFVDVNSFEAPLEMIDIIYNEYGLVPIGGSSSLNRAFFVNTRMLRGKSVGGRLFDDERQAHFEEVIHDWFEAFGMDQEIYNDDGDVVVKNMFKGCLFLLRTGEQMVSRKIKVLVLPGAGEELDNGHVSGYEDGVVMRTRPGILRTAMYASGFNPSNVLQGTLMYPYAKGIFSEMMFSPEEMIFDKILHNHDIMPDEVDGYINLDGCFGNYAKTLKPYDIIEVDLGEIKVINTSLDYSPNAKVSPQVWQYFVDEENPRAIDVYKRLVIDPMIEKLTGDNPDNITGHGRAQKNGFPKDYYLNEETTRETTAKAASKMIDSAYIKDLGCGATFKVVLVDNKTHALNVKMYAQNTGVDISDIDTNLIGFCSYEVWGELGLDVNPLSPFKVIMWKNPAMPLRMMANVTYLLPSSAVQGNIVVLSTDHPHNDDVCGDGDGDDVVAVAYSEFGHVLRAFLEDEDLPTLHDIRVPTEEVLGASYANLRNTATNNLDSAVGRAEIFLSQAFGICTSGSLLLYKDKANRNMIRLITWEE